MRGSSLLVFIALGMVGALGSAIPTKSMLSGRSTLRGTRRYSKLGIYHGSSTDVENYPYVASITYMGQAYCTGVIVSSAYVLTTADCLDQIDAYYTYIEAGANEATSGNQQLGAWSKTLHPDYNSTSGDYNFGLLAVDGSFSWTSTVKNISLPQKRVSAATWLSVVGYGESDENDNDLKMGKMAVVRNKKCETLYESYSTLSLTSRMGCMYNEKKTTVCDGDFGAPFVKEDVVYHLAASVASTGECSSSAYPVVTADVYSVVDWIKETINDD